MEFGKFKNVDLRDVWPHEAHNFTPWLADNLERLSEVVGIPLESGDTEVAVEQFYADILARNPIDDSPVLIENQYGSTNHDHLGKILTYLAGLEARTIIWISEHFHDAHLSAIRWLNENTTDPFSFFAVKLRVLQIADSPMVPVFEVLERPSDWDRQIRASAREKDGRLNELRQFRRDFWDFYAQRHPSDGVPPNYFGSNVFHDVSGLVVSQVLSVHSIGIYVRPRTGDDSEVSAKRVKCCSQILKVGGDGGDWRSMSTREQENWPEMADWLHDRLIDYKRVITENTADG